MKITPFKRSTLLLYRAFFVFLVLMSASSATGNVTLSNDGHLVIAEGTTHLTEEMFKKYSEYNFYKIKSIIIPNSVTHIEGFPFEDVSIECPLTIKLLPGNKNFCIDEEGVLTDKSGKTLIFVPRGIQGYEISPGITKIGDYAFYGCEFLEEVIIPESVQYIGRYAFARCSRLSFFKLPSKLTYIGKGAFWQACRDSDSKPIHLTIPEGVKKIEEYTFDMCEDLKSIKLPSGLTSIGKGAFSECKLLSNITIPESVESIDDRAFRNCPNLKNIELPSKFADRKNLIIRYTKEER